MRIARWMRRERNPRERRDDELKWIGARHEALLFLKSRIVLNNCGGSFASLDGERTADGIGRTTGQTYGRPL